MAFPNELDETSQQIVESVTEQYNEPPEGVEVYARGRWDYYLALTAEEDAEHGDLLARWEAGSLSESDPNFDRFVDLDDRFWFYGRQSEFDEWIAAGNTEEELLYRGSLTHDEFYEFVELEARFESGELDVADEDRFFELDARLYSFGVVTDYPDLQPEADSVAAMNDVMNEIIDLLSGATLTVAVDEMFGEPDVGLSLELAHGPAERLLDIPGLEEIVAEIGDEIYFADSSVVLGDPQGAGETLSEHPRFEEAFAEAPEDASLAVFMDVAALESTMPEPSEWLAPVSVVSAEGDGLVRILID